MPHLASSPHDSYNLARQVALSQPYTFSAEVYSWAMILWQASGPPLAPISTLSSSRVSSASQMAAHEKPFAALSLAGHTEAVAKVSCDLAWISRTALSHCSWLSPGRPPPPAAQALARAAVRPFERVLARRRRQAAISQRGAAAAASGAPGGGGGRLRRGAHGLLWMKAFA